MLSLVVFGLIIIVLLSYVANGYGISGCEKPFLYYCVWGIGGIFAGACCTRNKMYYAFIKLCDIVWIILTLGSFVFVVGLTKNQGWIPANDTGMNYQTASYCAALGLGINIYQIRNSEVNSEHRFAFACSRLFRLLSILMITIQIPIILLSGGRGGAVLAGIYILWPLVDYIKNNSIQKGLIVISIACLVIIAGYRYFMITAGGAGTWRFFTTDYARFELYRNTLRLIGEKPILGYGFFGYIPFLGIYRYPHNIVLQILLSCGFLGLIPISILFTILVKRILVIVKEDNSYEIIVTLLIYSLVYLTFSGSFIENSIFMFCIGFISCIKTCAETNIVNYRKCTNYNMINGW